MARKPEEEANHWPGFVDALSTIVMVITFLLILLGLTLFIMMQKIQTDADVALNTQVETDGKNGDQVVENQDPLNISEGAPKAEDSAAQVADLKDQLDQAQQELEKLKQAAKQKSGTPKAPEGVSIASLEADLLQQDQVETEDKLTILTRKVDEKVKIAIATDEQAQTNGNAKVTSAAIALELSYERDTTKLDEATTQKVGDFFTEKAAEVGDGVYEIRSIASSKVGSISEARRKAYFRALVVRNILLKRGVPTDRILTRVAMPQPGEDDDKVIVSVKPR